MRKNVTYTLGPTEVEMMIREHLKDHVTNEVKIKRIVSSDDGGLSIETSFISGKTYEPETFFKLPTKEDIDKVNDADKKAWGA